MIDRIKLFIDESHGGLNDISIVNSSYVLPVVLNNIYDAPQAQRATKELGSALKKEEIRYILCIENEIWDKIFTRNR